MKLDVLSNLDEILVCTHYKVNGRTVDLLPFGLEPEDKVEPIYERFRGWKTPLQGISSFEALPSEARDYVLALEEFIGARMDFISVGPDRSETIFRSEELFRGL